MWTRNSFTASLSVKLRVPSLTMNQISVVGVGAGLLIALTGLAAEQTETLPQTKPLEWEESDLSSRLMDGAHRFIERQIAESVAKRKRRA